MTPTLLHHDGTGSLPDRIYAYVVEAILRGDFAPHNKLPTESALGIQFGVSRPTVREALARLRSDGIIDSKRGAGSTVIRPPDTPAVATAHIKSLADIERYYAFRSCIEMGAAAGAAEYRDAEDLEALHASFAAQNTAMESGQSGAEEDVRFHLAIARAAHNPFFVAAIGTSVAPIRQFIALARNVTDKESPTRVDATQAEHLAILDAIVRRASAEAAEAVRIHLLNAKRRIFEGTPLP